jgi:transposase InsO family protein
LFGYLQLGWSLLHSALSSRQRLILQNIALRHQLAVLTRNPKRPKLKKTDRVFWSWLSPFWSQWRNSLYIVQPETVIRWQRSGWRKYWRWKSRDGRGRSRISQDVQDLIGRMVKENPRWGNMRIKGELQKLGFPVSHHTVRRYRRKGNHKPPSQSWHTFLRNHAPRIWAADFFTVQTLTFKTLYVFFFISHHRRELVHINVTAHPTMEWVWRQLIEATPWGEQPSYLIRDRDDSYGGSFNLKAAKIGIKGILTPIQAPKANAVAERVIGTLRRECLDHMIVINEAHLRRVLKEYVAHYNGSRPHRTPGLETPTGPPSQDIPLERGRIVSKPVLGGLHHEYGWEAA